MKRRIAYTLAALAIVLLIPVTLQGQEQLLFRVNIPFEFVAGGAHLTPGEYLAFHATPTIIKLVREDGRGSAWITVKPSPVLAEGETNQIVFRKYGNTYFLAKVQTGHDQQSHECYRCREEQVLSAQYRGPEATMIALAVTPAK